MKKFRMLAAILAVVSLLTLTVGAVAFTPSIERKDGPVLVEGDDALIFTPVSHLYNDKAEDLHEDIKESLTAARDELKQSTWKDLIPDFEAQWEKYTGGAPVDHAIVSDIFDVRYQSELGTGDAAGKEVTFSITIQGLTADDVFMVIVKSSDEEGWKVIDYTMSEDGVLTITVKTKSVVAIVRDNGAPVPQDPDAPDSPQTGVSPYFWPAIIGGAVFTAVAVLCIVKLAKRRTA